jgi:hypothetical protein
LTNIDEREEQVTNTIQTQLLRAVVYLEARARRNNLIFKGMVEVRGENCYNVITDFLETKLGINSNEVYIARAHRLGAREQGTNFHKRPIIANFRDYGDVELILSKAKD